MEEPQFFSHLFPIPSLPNTQALTSSTFKKPPLDGSLTIPQIFDWHYEHTPDHPVFVYVDGDSTKTIFWPEVARAVHVAGRFALSALAQERERSDVKERPTVAILAASDSITYFTLIVGLMRADCVPFLVSPRNSAAAVAHLLGATRTDHVLVGREPALRSLASSAFAIMKANNPDCITPTDSLVPAFEDLYLDPGVEVDFLPALKSDISSIALILHSSGSTAFPKPRPSLHITVLQTGFVPYFGECDLCGKRLSVHAIPMYHGMGVMQTGWTATVGVVLTVAKPQSPAIQPSPDNVYKGFDETQSNVFFCVPVFLEIWARNPVMVARLKEADGVLYGGGPLNKTVGDMLVQNGVKIFTLYGCTELGILTPVLPRESSLDWEYFTVTKQIKCEYVGNGFGQAELVVTPNPYESPSVINGKTPDGQDAYYTSDLLIPHPSLPGRWKLYGRADDQLMHNTGEKTNPGPLESIINQDHHVRSAVMFGRGHFNVGIIIDPYPQYAFDPSDEEKLSQFRNGIWPTVKRMNAYAPQHSRLFKEMILVASPSKPFEYTVKSTARRQTVIQAYELEIAALYDAVEATTRPYSDVVPPEDWSLPSALAVVRDIVRRVLHNDLLPDDADIFQHGCDSLQATWIRNTLMLCMKNHAELDVNAVPHDLVFENPTIAALAVFASKASLQSFKISSVTNPEAKILAMHEAVQRHTTRFPVHVANPAVPFPTKDGVLVTGTTGSIGARVLSQLLEDDKIGRVYAVNRRHKDLTSLIDRQKAAFEKQDIPTRALLSETLTLVDVEMDDDNLGLSSALLEEIRRSVTHIIHIAWRVDFNLSIASFEPNIRGLRAIVDLALSSQLPTPPRVIFTSSISVVAGSSTQDSVAEAPVGAQLALASGYSQSKWVSEAILEASALETTLRPITIRVGQVSGDASGYWNTTEWFPAMVKTSVALGGFPGGDARISWIPLDLAADFIVAARNARSPVLHLVHTKPAPWELVARTVASELDLRVTSYADWLSLLEFAKKSSSQTDTHPALKILPFFQRARWTGAEAMGLPDLDTTLARDAAPALRSASLAPISEQDVCGWLRSWKKQGFLPLP